MWEDHGDVLLNSTLMSEEEVSWRPQFCWDVLSQRASVEQLEPVSSKHRKGLCPWTEAHSLTLAII